MSHNRPRTLVISRRAPGRAHRQEAYYRTDWTRLRKAGRPGLAAAAREFTRKP